MTAVQARGGPTARTGDPRSRVPVRTIAATIGMVLLTAAVLLLGWEVRRVLTWIVVGRPARHHPRPPRRPHRAPAPPAPTGSSRSWGRAAFDPTGRRLATAFLDGTILVWDVDPASWLKRACAVASRRLTEQEWQDFLPGRPYQPSCGGP
jgi:hypothetical protein